ncbi:MAG: hypothetical protein HY243_00565 [Proteobacteria bacterium]|nr:hypothetical protein [Pseudomonadota bacterium]
MRILLAAVAVLSLAACTTEEQAKQSRPSTHQAAENLPYQPVRFAMPPGSTIDRNNTVAVGDSVQWFGTLALTSSLDIDGTSEYYNRELAAQGWEPLSSLIADRVILQFVNRQKQRACIVTIESGNMWSGTHVEIVVAPLVSRANIASR